MSEQSPKPPREDLESAPRSSPPSFAELVGAAKREERDYSRLLLALCGAMAVVAASVCGAVLVDRLRLPNLAIQESQEEQNSPRDAEKLLQDVLAGQRQAKTWDPIQFKASPQGGEEGPTRLAKHPAGQTAGSRKGQPKQNDRRSGEVSEATTADGIDPIYAALWGSGERYAALGRRAPSEAAPIVLEREGAPDSKGTGTVMAARLLDQIAGSPVGAPVIATLVRKQQLGELRIPAGSEAHGTVVGTGADDTRIFLDFDFILLRGGRVVPLRGVARDPQGRHGIPARRLLGRGAAGSIGLSSASRAFREVGRHIAGRVGDAVGAGLEGATESASEKSRRVDRDEHVLVAEAGAPLAIYVLGTG